MNLKIFDFFMENNAPMFFSIFLIAAMLITC